MREKAAVRGELRGHLGTALGVMGGGEAAVLARLLEPDEPLEAALVAATRRLRGLGLPRTAEVLAVTPRRLLLVHKAFVLRRERFREVPLADLRGVRRLGPAGLRIDHAGGTLDLHAAGPEAGLLRTLDLLRERLGDPVADREEVAEVVERKLGRPGRRALGPHVDRLAEALGRHEAVIDVGRPTEGEPGLLALTSDRLLLVPARRRGPGEVEEVDLAEVEHVVVSGEDLVLRGPGPERRFGAIRPGGRANDLGTRLRPRLR